MKFYNGILHLIDIKSNIRLVELTARYSQILDVSRFRDKRIQSIQLAPLVSYTILHSMKLYYIRYIELFWCVISKFLYAKICRIRRCTRHKSWIRKWILMKWRHLLFRFKRSNQWQRFRLHFQLVLVRHLRVIQLLLRVLRRRGWRVKDLKRRFPRALGQRDVLITNLRPVD